MTHLVNRTRAALVAVLAAALFTTGCIVDVPNPYANRSVITPVEVAGGRLWQSVASGFMHTCALTTTGQAYCWGNNRARQLGVETTETMCEMYPCSRTPVAVTTDLRFTQISSFGDRSCGLTADGTAWCWGMLSVQAGGDVTSATPVAVASDAPFTQVSAGGCALTNDARVYCWGNNFFGELGDGTTVSRADARPISSTLRFTVVSKAGAHACALAEDGSAYCWGENRWGQLGVGEVPYNNFGAMATTPRRVETDTKFTAIAAGGLEFTCGLTTTGRAWCWGRDENASQLGDRTPSSHRGTPGPVADDRAFVSLSSGDITSCGVTAANESWCWGSNYFGALTDPGVLIGGGIDYPVKTRGGPYRAVSVGGSHACGIRTDDRLFCWGDGFYGQVGAG